MKFLHFIYNGFSEYEVALPCSLLAQVGKIETVALNKEPVLGEGHFQLLPHRTFDETDPAEYQLLLISGTLDALPYWEETKIFEFIQRFHATGSTIAAICGGPLFLAKSGVLSDVKYTCGLSPEGQQKSGVFPINNFVDEDVVIDKNIITSKGYATVSFALAIGDSLSVFKNQEVRDSFSDFWEQA